MNVIQSALYSPNLGEHFKYLLYGDLTLRKFFSADRSSETPSKSHFSSLFTAFSLLKSSFQRSSKYQNRSALTFASIKRIDASCDHPAHFVRCAWSQRSLRKQTVSPSLAQKLFSCLSKPTPSLIKIQFF